MAAGVIADVRIKEELASEEDKQATLNLLNHATRAEVVTESDITTEDANNIGRDLRENATPINELLNQNQEIPIEELAATVLQTMLDPSTTQTSLNLAFDQAFDSFIRTEESKFNIFLKCVMLAIVIVVAWYQKNDSDTTHEWVVRTVGHQLIRTAIRYKLYTYITSSGGWHSLRVAVSEYITRLTELIQRNRHQTLAIFGTAVVAAVCYMYIFRK